MHTSSQQDAFKMLGSPLNIMSMNTSQKLCPLNKHMYISCDSVQAVELFYFESGKCGVFKACLFLNIHMW